MSPESYNGSSIESIAKHNFAFGLETAVTNPAARINSVSGRLTFTFPPVRVDDPLWHGDCTTDAALSREALSEISGVGPLLTERMKYQHPEVGLDAWHFRTVIPQCDSGTFDHSSFFHRLNPRYQTQIGIEDHVGQRVENTVTIDDTPRNYKEFESNGDTYLMAARLVYQDAQRRALVVPILLYQQDSQGNLIKGYGSAIAVPIPEEPVTEEKVLDAKGSGKIVVIENGSGYPEQMPEGRLQTEIISCQTALLNAYVRGVS